MRWRETCWRYIHDTYQLWNRTDCSIHVALLIIIRPWSQVDKETKCLDHVSALPHNLSVFPQLLVNRSKRKRRRRADKALTGAEKVKVINMRTGKKVRRTVIGIICLICCLCVISC